MDLYDAASYHQLALHAEHGTAAASEQTRKLYLTYQRRFIRYLELRKIPRTLDALSATHVRAFIIWMQDHPTGKRGGQVARSTAGTILRRWSRFLAAEGILPHPTLEAVKPVRVTQFERVPYSRSDVLALLQACHAPIAGFRPWPLRDQALIYLLLDTGARISEITNLTLADVKLKDYTITVHGKGDKVRSIPFGDRLAHDGGASARTFRAYLKERADLLGRYPYRENDAFLLGRNGIPLSSDAAEIRLKKIGQAAGVEDVIPHRFRHTFATVYLTMYPGDTRGLRRLLGHVSSEMLEVYVHLAEATVQQRARTAVPSQTWLHGNTKTPAVGRQALTADVERAALEPTPIRLSPARRSAR